MRIRKQKFENEEVTLDGNIFEDCQFLRCRMQFQGMAPVSFLGCAFEDVGWNFAGPAALAMQFLKVLTEETGDYGKGLMVNTFPALRDWIKPEILAKLPGLREVPNG